MEEMGVGVEDVDDLVRFVRLDDLVRFVRLDDLPDEDGGNDEVDLEELEESFALL